MLHLIVRLDFVLVEDNCVEFTLSAEARHDRDLNSDSHSCEPIALPLIYPAISRPKLLGQWGKESSTLQALLRWLLNFAL